MLNFFLQDGTLEAAQDIEQVSEVKTLSIMELVMTGGIGGQIIIGLLFVLLFVAVYIYFERLFAIKVFNQAKDDNVSYEEYATQLAALLTSNKNALVVFYELLFELAMADGVLDPAEEALLRKTPSIFGIDQNLFNQLKDQFSGNSSDPYKVLGVTKDMPFDAIKKVYQKKRREFHPDTLISKGLPDELLDKAKEKFIEIQQAFEILEKKNSN